MPRKSILADLHIMLTHPESKLNEWERRAVASAKSLLEQDKEDGKDRARLDWLENPLSQQFLYGTFVSGGSNKAVRVAIDTAMATTTEKGEG